MSNSKSRDLSLRPDILTVSSESEFRQWYWLKQEMLQFCKARGIPGTGNKLEIRQRIIDCFQGKPPVLKNKLKKQSSFNWANAPLSLQTEISDSVTFGKNFRGFMTEHIGPRFVCHGDFMQWVKSNPGKNLEQAIQAWHSLENRKLNPEFKRRIAPQNMLAQYTRDFFKDNPNLSRQDLMNCWNYKKSLPVEDGKVVYESEDLACVQKTSQ